ncbi:NirD/YgiW/YdeI family stress tolerance protein [Pseudomonas panipatensis]|uniref:TIGR00156 family protein n=1 Tax=Pseudomonas panipatensis TaxID=428992 RepID=A0A1G8JYB1_9PSED|nr:NirD/YgiW/YdeI family stress tolerance protein [Pseudomonas panipatensis]SDI36196.1 TIGR00156 family protein [Pseudomonas panipatensis]SMP61814.1 TIGR00156 family protein [Pseudomonas panipatensis]
MKLRHFSLLGAIALFSGASVAAGYVGPGSDSAAATTATPLTTVKQALTAADDTPVRLEGSIVKRIEGEHYQFKDASGSIRVEIGSRQWPAEAVSESTKVRLSGEVDVDHKRHEIDVDQLEIIQ